MKKCLAGAIAILAMVTGSALRADVVDGSGAGFAIPDNVPAGASSTINIAANETINGNVVLTIRGFTHTWIGDLIARLTGPGGTIDILRRTGSTTGTGVGDSSNLLGTYNFRDSGGNIWTAAAGGASTFNIPAGDYQASTTGPVINLGTQLSLNAFFAGTSTQGSWTLSISDNAGADVGSITGWGLDIQSFAVPEPGFALLGLMGLGLVIRRRR